MIQTQSSPTPPQTPALDPPTRELTALLKSKHSLIWIATPEEPRVEAAVMQVAHAGKFEVRFWSVTRGMRDYSGKPDGAAGDAQAPEDALKVIAEARPKSPTIWVLRDLHAFLESPINLRWLREIAIAKRAAEPVQAVLILCPSSQIPADLEKDTAFIDWPLPTRDQLGMIVDRCVKSGVDSLLTQLPAASRTEEVRAKIEAYIWEDPRELVIESLCGLTGIEAENAIAKLLVSRGRVRVEELILAKREIVAKAGICEMVDPPSGGLAEIGGLERLKAWALKRRRTFNTTESRAAKVDAPRGCLAVGPAGTGKSLFAKCLAAAWRLPLLKLDAGRLMGSLVGESEASTRAFLKLARAMAPVVVSIDELNMMFSGTGTDTSGVTTRMTGALMTAMQEQDPEHPIYWVATCNSVDGLPPALLRAGRFDAIWSVDLPNPAERQAVLAVHLKKRGRELPVPELTEMVRVTESFSGAEIEQAVKDAVVTAFDSGRDLLVEDLVEAARAIVPLSQTARGEVQAIQEWCKTRARPASEPWSEPSTTVEAPPARALDLSAVGPIGGGN